MKVEMKDSGIPWVGVIPKDWELSKIKRIMRNKSIRNYPNEMVLSLYREYGVIPKDSRDDNHNVTSEDTTNYKFVEVGDFVINKMKAWQGSMGLSEYRGIISPAYYVCRFIGAKIFSKYIHHLLRNETYKPEYMRLSTGLRIGQWDLGIEDFLNIPIILPPTDIQIKIVSFLDDKCADIDQLITLQQQMIDELKAYKQSVITETVCKGLDKSVPMKDSGIEWIGEVPESWEICRIKNMILFNPNHQNTIGLKDEDIVSFMPMECLRMNIIEQRTLSYKEALKYTPFENEDIVIAKVTPCFENKNIAIATNLKNGFGFGTSEIFVIRCNDGLYNQFLLYYLMSNYIFSIGVASMTGTGGLKRVSPKALNDAALLLPSIQEQQAIVKSSNVKSSQIDTLISIKKQKIDELKEYKKSMIYEYITGKKQVPK